MSTTPPVLHADVTALAALLGTWRGEGRGEYPTIEPFGYDEEVTFGHVGKPFLVYGQRTWRQPDRFPLHAESGYLRLIDGARAELLLAHPTGVAEVSEGSWDGRVLHLRSTVIARSRSAKEVTALERRFELDGDVLRYTLAMAAVGQRLTDHLAAQLHRVA